VCVCKDIRNGVEVISLWGIYRTGEDILGDICVSL
jgi:hypothetical protein